MREVDRAFVERLLADVRDDGRVCALFLGGSHASGTADPYSDLDLYLVTRDEDFDSWRSDRRTVLSRLGDPVFLEEHELFGFLLLLFMYDDGVHGEMAVAPAVDLADIHSGPFVTLIDKDGLLEGREFPAWRLDDEERQAVTRRLLVWFWYDLRLLDVALARGHLWTAHHYLERCRRACAELARLRAEPDAWPDGYERLERVVDDGTRSALAASVVPLDAAHMRRAADVTTRLCLDIGREVADRQGIPFPERLAAHVSRQRGS
jgi:hypothetical protein